MMVQKGPATVRGACVDSEPADHGERAFEMQASGLVSPRPFRWGASDPGPRPNEGRVGGGMFRVLDLPDDSQAMEIAERIACPYCGQSMDLVVDTSVPEQRFTTDCEVCCRPFEVFVECEPGEILSIDVQTG